MAIELSKRCDISVSVKGVGVSYIQEDSYRYSYPFPISFSGQFFWTTQFTWR